MARSLPERFALMCDLCEDKFSEPRRLPCEHIFCTKCLATYIRGTARGGEFPCPTCEEGFDVPQGGTVGVRDAFPSARDRLLGKTVFGAERNPSDTTDSRRTLSPKEKEQLSAQWRVDDVSLQSEDDVSGLVAVASGLIVAHDADNILYVYDHDGKCVARVPVPGLQEPATGSLVLLSGYAEVPMKLAVAGSARKSLHCFTLTSDWAIRDHIELELDYQPTTMSVDQATGELLVTDWRHRQLHSYHLTSTVQETGSTTLPPAISDPVCGLRLSNAQYVILDSPSMQLFAPQEGDHQVAWLDSTASDITTRYPSRSQHPTLGKCIQMISDDAGCILVADMSQHHVLRVGKNGQSGKCLLQGQLRAPYHLHLDPTGVLYVVHCPQDVSMVRVIRYNIDIAEEG